MTLTTEQLREIAEKIDSPPSNITTRVMAEMARELLANREAKPAAGELGEIRVGRLPTMNQEEYPGLGDWWVQLRMGANHDEILARVYGATPDEAVARARLLTAPPAPAARIAGYFVRQRPKWDERAPWTPWKEVDEASYDDFVKIIATGEAYCGWFYDTRILYTAPPAPTLPAELLDAVDEVIRISDRDHDAWARAKEAITACRAAMLAAAPATPEESSD
ncbi:hypothetical protein ACTVLL_11265 [Serratia nevei]|uniref:hypothetical protein n=1 Tax=Serratia nevei TaxID=2703794 RepID=UPI003FA7396C